MIIQQLSVFLENRSGRLAKVLEVLGDKNIRIIALTVADTTDFGILRMLVSDPTEARSVLKDNSFSVNKTDVLAIQTNGEAKRYAEALKILSDLNISIEYTYSFSLHEGSVVVLQCNDNESAIKALTDNGITLMKADEIYGV